MKWIAVLALLAGCATISDIDASRAAPVCATQCTQDHSRCVSRPASPLMSSMLTYQCKDNYRSCIQACPTRN
jgi:hypothetical protein